MPLSRHKLTGSLATGLQKGLGGFIWMLKILVPISLLTALLAWSGWLNSLDFILVPMMKLIGLPPFAALPLVAGLLTGPYGAIAAMAPLPLTLEQMTLLAVFLLISHNLIQEGVIQAKSGLAFLPATLFRLFASMATVMLISLMMGMEAEPLVPLHQAAASRTTLAATIAAWAMDTLLLAAKILMIIMPIMIGMEVMKTYRLIDRMVDLLAPFLKVLGLRRETGFLWLTAVVFGLTYGAAVIVEEVRQGKLDKGDLERLHVSIGINHSMIEDPALFMAVGLGFWWMVVPRLLAAVCAVHLFTMLKRLPADRFLNGITLLRNK